MFYSQGPFAKKPSSRQSGMFLVQERCAARTSRFPSDIGYLPLTFSLTRGFSRCLDAATNEELVSNKFSCGRQKPLKRLHFSERISTPG